MKNILPFILFLIAESIPAQSKLPVIKASSKSVSINDGGSLSKNAWMLSPEIKPDIFTADRARKTKWVTFYTDIDSIRVKVKPGTAYNFIIVWNGKDTCYTQIKSAIGADTVTNNTAAHDTIPFTLTAFNAICVKALINNTDTLNLHFDVGSFDFRFTKETLLKKGYNKSNRVFKLQMGNLVWHNPGVRSTGTTSYGMDGRFGWNLFEGKTIEIDYDHNLLIIHARLPKNLKGYAKSKIEFMHSFVCVKAAFEIEHKKYAGDFLLDTGSDQAIVLDSAWAGKQNFPKNLKLIRSSVLSDPKGVKYETKIVLSPLLKINTFELLNIPTYLLSNKNPVGFEINYLGNDLLKRFNLLLDFKNDCLYLKPNKLMGVKYRDNS